MTSKSSPKMKMSTTVPPGIESPDRVETRIGTLNFFDGFRMQPAWRSSTTTWTSSEPCRPICWQSRP